MNQESLILILIKKLEILNNNNENFLPMNYKSRILIFLGIILFSCNLDIRFDSEKWKNAGGENIMLDTRLKMTNDLIERKVLINKSEMEIIDLLGSSSKLGGFAFKNIKYFPVQEIYARGVDPKKMIFLKIEFNKMGKADSVCVYSVN
jgi:hypothetical protein